MSAAKEEKLSLQSARLKPQTYTTLQPQTSLLCSHIPTLLCSHKLILLCSHKFTLLCSHKPHYFAATNTTTLQPQTSLLCSHKPTLLCSHKHHYFAVTNLHYFAATNITILQPQTPKLLCSDRPNVAAATLAPCQQQTPMVHRGEATLIASRKTPPTHAVTTRGQRVNDYVHN